LPEVETNGIEVPAVDAWNAWRPEEIAERLAVLPREVVDTTDRRSAAERAVGSAAVVVVEPV
jgi:hypothetical protein